MDIKNKKLLKKTFLIILKAFIKNSLKEFIKVFITLRKEIK